jgi:DNA-binding NarL/FixJ family response regulator
MPIRLLIADHHKVVRECLATLLESAGIQVTALAATGSAAVRLAQKHDVQVALVDIRMPDGDGFFVLRQLKKTRPKLPVLMYSSDDSPSWIALSRELGASGYLVKGTEWKTLVAAICTVGAGQDLWALSGADRRFT